MSPNDSPETAKWSQVRRRDRRLVEACLNGDEDAWAEVWQRYGPLVKAVARRTGCDDEETRDILQRVALVAFTGLARLEDGGKLGGWLASVARFQALEVIRQRRPAEELFESTAVIAAEHHDALERTQLQARVHQTLLAVDERCQRLIRRLDLKDPPDTYAQVAADEGLSPTSLGPIRRRCLNRLRKILEGVSR